MKTNEEMRDEIEALDGAERAAFEYLRDVGKDDEDALRMCRDVLIIPERDAGRAAEELFYDCYSELTSLPSAIKFAIDWEIVAREMLTCGDWNSFPDSDGDEWVVMSPMEF